MTKTADAPGLDPVAGGQRVGIRGAGADLRQRLAPSRIMLCAMVVCVAAAALTIAIATSRPWLGVQLVADAARNTITIASVSLDGPAIPSEVAPGRRLTAIEVAGESGSAPQVPPMALNASDLVEEPDGLDSYAAVTEFLNRQTQLADILLQRTVHLHVVNDMTRESHVTTIHPRTRPITALPAVFWVQLLSGLAGFSIGAMVWSMRRGDLAAQMFALSGLGLLVSALPAAIYSTRELAIDGDLFAVLSALNHLGTHMFGGAMIALFLTYPRRLVRPAWLLVIPAILLPWLYADVTQRMPDPVTGMYVPMLAEMVAIVVLVLVQRRLARNAPATRAALRWLGLSVVVGAGAFVGGIAVPLLLDAAPAISQGYAFAFFLLVYGGIALGIRRYRLFDLGDWAFRILFYTGGAVLLLLLDAALIWILHVERGPALGASLLIVGFAYLPLRDALWRRVYAKRVLPEHELFAAAMEVAFGLTKSERAERWRRLLMRLYDPLEITSSAQQLDEAAADPDGLELNIPAVADSAALRLRYPFGGKGMFGPRDLQLANQLVALIVQAEANRDAYARGVLEERQRIARDLHDDVGARLLTGLHSVDDRTRPVLQAALSDIRAIVSGLTGEQASLDRVLAEARHETARRLEAAGIALDWPLQDEQAERFTLDYRQTKALTSSVREILSNVIRHAHASRVRADIALSDAEIVLRIVDNGRGMPSAGEGRGFGLKNIQRRIEDVGGRLTITSSPSGTAMEIVVPLTDVQPAPPEQGLAAREIPLSSAT